MTLISVNAFKAVPRMVIGHDVISAMKEEQAGRDERFLGLTSGRRNEDKGVGRAFVGSIERDGCLRLVSRRRLTDLRRCWDRGGSCGDKHLL